MKKKLWIIGLFVVLVLCSAGCGEKDDPIAESLEQFIIVEKRCGQYPIEMMEENIAAGDLIITSENMGLLLTDDQRDDILNGFRTDIFPYRSPEQVNIACEAYLTALTPKCFSNWELHVDDGVLDFDFEKAKIDKEDPNKAVASCNYIGWTLWIEEETPGETYVLRLVMSEFIRENEMHLSNGTWIVGDNLKLQQNIAPIDYDGVLGTYATFAEALAAAKTVDPAEKNPF